MVKFGPLLLARLSNQRLLVASIQLFNVDVSLTFDLTDLILVFALSLHQCFLHLGGPFQTLSQAGRQLHFANGATQENDPNGVELFVEVPQDALCSGSTQTSNCSVRLLANEQADGLLHRPCQKDVEVGRAKLVHELVGVADPKDQRRVDVHSNVVRGWASCNRRFVGAGLLRDHVGNSPPRGHETRTGRGDAVIFAPTLHHTVASGRDADPPSCW
mmetsp:Transcript_50820/g.107852  ORF Transcript_50820/g.107852 Transcript_50820/m.107852 type:complete len:216 (-) Transcript_50820:218-865(-)